MPESDIWIWVILGALALTGLIVLIQSQKEAEHDVEVVFPSGVVLTWAEYQELEMNPDSWVHFYNGPFITHRAGTPLTPEQEEWLRDESLKAIVKEYKPLLDRLEKEGD